MLQAAMDGRGVALGQMLIVAGDIAAGRLVPPLSFRLPTGCSYYIVCLPAAADRPKIIAFRKWVMEELNGPNGSREVAADDRSRPREARLGPGATPNSDVQQHQQDDPDDQ